MKSPSTNATPGSPPSTLLVTENVPVTRTTWLPTVTVPFGWAAVRVTGTPIVLAPQAYEGSPGLGGVAGSFSVTEQVEVSRIWSAPPVRVAAPAPVRVHVPLLVSSAVVQLQVPVNVVPAPVTPLRGAMVLVMASAPKARFTWLVTVTAVAWLLVLTVTSCAGGCVPRRRSRRPAPGRVAFPRSRCNRCRRGAGVC